MQFEQLLNVELGSLEDLDLEDGDVLEGEDGRAALFAFLTNGIRDELGNQVLDFTTGNFAADDFEHALADGADLSALSVAGLLDLLRATLGESDGEQAQQVTVGGLDVDVGFNEALPLLDHGTELVLGKGHAVEIGQAGLALDFVDAQAELAEGDIFALGVQVTQAKFEDTSLQAVFSGAHTLSAVNQGLASIAVGEEGGSTEVVPFFAGEGLNSLLGLSLFTLCQAFVFTNSLDEKSK